jgi:hypothetical protein
MKARKKGQGFKVSRFEASRKVSSGGGKGLLTKEVMKQYLDLEK